MASSGLGSPAAGDYTDLAVYAAVYNYSPSRDDQEEGYIEIRENDLLEVVNPLEEEDFVGTLENPEGWLRGTNQRSMQVRDLVKQMCAG